MHQILNEISITMMDKNRHQFNVGTLLVLVIIIQNDLLICHFLYCVIYFPLFFNNRVIFKIWEAKYAYSAVFESCIY